MTGVNMSNDTKASPVIEHVDVQQATIQLSVNMKLAGMPVSVSGQYNIHSNCYYPSTVRKYIEESDSYESISTDLDSYCEEMDWDYYDTYDAIQEAVERRDQ